MYVDPSAWVQPDQMACEFADLLDLYEKLEPDHVLEIGVRQGGSFYQWMKHAKNGATIVGIDFPIGKWGENIIADYPRFWQFAGHKALVINVILGDSHHHTAQDAISGMLGWIDFAFIDGDHSYQGVKSDFEFCKTLIAPGGVIAIHDILPNTRDKDIEVPRYWAELKNKFTCAELISEGNQNGYGIGLVYL